MRMEILLEEFYKTDIVLEKYHDRKFIIDKGSCQICGITQSGKSKVAKNYLNTLKKRSYLYIDCSDERIDVEQLNKSLPSFCHTHGIECVVLDNYRSEILPPAVAQLIVIAQAPIASLKLPVKWLYPLDYEEFLAYEHKYDSTALNHFLQLGGLPVMHKIPSDERIVFIQEKLKLALDSTEFALLKFIAKQNATPLSAYAIYERLKQTRKISKDKTYTAYKSLCQKNYIIELTKFNHPKAVAKLYLSDIFFKSALTTDKHFGRLFENMVLLELVKHQRVCYYSDEIDFYLPDEDEIILCKPFADERRLFQKLESIEAFIFSYKIRKITAVTMSKEGTLSHPLAKVEMIPFDIWALGD